MKQLSIRFGVGFDLIIEAENKITDSNLLKLIRINPKKANEYRAAPHNFERIIKILKQKQISIVTDILKDSTFSQDYINRVKLKLNLRPYQEQAISEFFNNDNKGVVVLPTAAGKTIIGFKIVEKLKQKTLIMVPTKNLLHQWIDHLTKYTSLSKDMIGQVGDNVKEIKEITVTTYDSARLNLNSFRKIFNLVILDEAHHAAAKETIKVLEGLPAVNRLGLTATPDRSDKGEDLLFKLIGDPIIVAKISDLAENGFIAKHQLKTLKVPLTEEERILYDKNMGIYRGYLRRRNIQIRSPEDYERHLIFRVNQDVEAKEALDAHRIARNIVFSSQSKLDKIEELLEKHSLDKMIIFSEFNDMVYSIGRKHLIPVITHETKSSEREEILHKFSLGEYNKIVTGRVLDEGWDCGSVNVGVIVSGTGQARQFIQRLGRILRPKEGVAILYELVTPDTLETGTVKRRKKAEVL
ncbi:MAG: DEAD/DEAH box helicase [Candidatus Heimdallarchaeota archaeon]|nr:DEAD/DEAH box helicase [Candidatus Heimdallarchaeota archaeon]